MNSWPYYSSGGGEGSDPPPKKEITLQGPKPPSLEVSKESHKIRKPPRAPLRQPLPYHSHHQQQPPPQFRNPAESDRQPVIIYDVSPRVIHATADEFRNLVQRLTGIASEEQSADEEGPSSVWAAAAASDAPISPAERLAALDRASPTGGRGRERDRVPGPSGEEPMMDIMAGLDLVDMAGMLDLGQQGSLIPGILSPAPANLPLPPPAESWAQIGGYQDSNTNIPLSPFGGNSLLPSPSWNQSLFPSPSSNYSTFLSSPGSNSYFFSSAPISSPVMSPVMDFSNIFNS